MSTNTLTQSPVFWFVLIGGLAFARGLPLIITLIRNFESLALVVIFNAFPVAWPAALVLACMMPRKEPACPPLHYQPPAYPASPTRHW